MHIVRALGARLRSWAASRWMARAGAVLFVVSIPIALVGSNVRILFGTQQLYTFAINRYDVAAVSGIPAPELLRATHELRAYLLGPGDLVHITVTDDAGRVGPLFNEREVLHLRDVKHLLGRIFDLQEAALVVALGYSALRIALGRRKGLLSVARLIWVGGTATNVAAIAVAVSAMLGFDRLFTEFHMLSFSNDFWQLDPARDHLIQMFPLPFWEVATGLLIGMTLIESAALALAGWWWVLHEERAAHRQPMTNRSESEPKPVRVK